MHSPARQLTLGGLRRPTVRAAAAVMAARFLITRILLMCWLKEVCGSSAFPSVGSYASPKAWRGGKLHPEGPWLRRPLQYIYDLRQSPRSMATNVVPYQAPIKPWQKASILMRPRILSQSQPQSGASLKRPQEVYPQQESQLSPQPRSFHFNLKLPTFGFLGPKKETGSPTKGSDVNGADASQYSPGSVELESSFQSGSDDLGSKGSSKGGQTGHDVSKPTFQLSLSVPIPPKMASTTASPSTPSVDHFPSQQVQSIFIQNSYLKPATPQTSYTQTGSQSPVSYSAEADQQQSQQQIYEPVHTKPADAVLTVPSKYPSQYTPTESITQEKLPTEQKPGPSPSLPISKYPQYSYGGSGLYSTQTDPARKDYGTGQTATSSYSNVAPSSPQYGVHSGTNYASSYSAGADQQQSQQQIYEPVHTKPADAVLTIPSKYPSQYTPTESITQEKLPTEQKPGPSLPISKYPQYSYGGSGLYSTQTDPARKDYGTGQTATSGYSNLAPASSPQYGVHSGTNYASSYPAGAGQQQSQQQPIYRPVHTKLTDAVLTVPSRYSSQYTTPTEPGSLGKIPIKQGLLFPKPGMTKPQSPTQPIPKYPQRYVDSASEYYSTQISPERTDYGVGAPDLTPSLHAGAQSGHYSGAGYAQGPTSKPVGTLPTFPSEKSPDELIKKYMECKRFVEAVNLQSGQPSSSLYGLLSSGFHNRDVAATPNYQAGKEVQTVQKYESSGPYQYSNNQDGQDPVDALRNLQGLSAYPTHTSLPGQDADGQKLDGRTKYTKAVGDVTDAAQGQTSFAGPTYWTRHNAAEPSIKTANPAYRKFSSQMSASQFPGLLDSTYPSKTLHIPVNKIQCKDGQCSYAPVKPGQTPAYSSQEKTFPSPYIAAGSFPPNADQQFPESSLHHPLPNVYGPSKGQYPAGPAQPQEPATDGCNPYDPSYYPGKKCSVPSL